MFGSIVHLNANIVRFAYFPGNIVSRDHEIEPWHDRNIDDTSSLPAWMPIFAEDIFDGCLGNPTARESCVPGPESLFAGDLVTAVVQLDLDGTKVRP